MPPKSRLPGWLLAAALLIPAGCQKLSDEKTADIGPEGGLYSLRYEGPRGKELVRVEVSSAGAPVDVYLVLEKDVAAAERSLAAKQSPAEVLDKKEKATEATLEGAIPGKQAFRVLIHSAQAATVTVRTKNQ